MKGSLYSLLFFGIHQNLLAGQIPFEIENKHYGTPTKLEISILYEGDDPKDAPLIQFDVPSKEENSNSSKKTLLLEEKLIKKIAFLLCKNEEKDNQEVQGSPSKRDFTAPTTLAVADFLPENRPLTSLKAVLNNQLIEILATYSEK